MAIHDADKDNTDRGSPAVNGHDKAGDVRMAHGTNSVNYTTDASPVAQSGVLFGNAQLVQTGSHTITVSGLTTDTLSFSHGLGYTPIMTAAVNNASATIAGGTATGVSLYLPTFLSADLTGSSIAFGIWLYGFCNSTTVYFNLLNTLAVGGHVTVTYYLYRQAAD